MFGRRAAFDFEGGFGKTFLAARTDAHAAAFGDERTRARRRSPRLEPVTTAALS